VWFPLGKREEIAIPSICHPKNFNLFNGLHYAYGCRIRAITPYVTYCKAVTGASCLDLSGERIAIQPQNNTPFPLFYVVIGVEMKKVVDTASSFWSTSKRRFGNKPKADSVGAKALCGR
jgi:hypothetical protein